MSGLRRYDISETTNKTLLSSYADMRLSYLICGGEATVTARTEPPRLKNFCFHFESQSLNFEIRAEIFWSIAVRNTFRFFFAPLFRTRKVKQ